MKVEMSAAVETTDKVNATANAKINVNGCMWTGDEEVERDSRAGYRRGLVLAAELSRQDLGLYCELAG